MRRFLPLLPFLTLIGGATAQTPEWVGYPVDENGWADAQDWLGWVNVAHSPWIYILQGEDWVYMEEPASDAVGAWAWLVRADPPAVDASLLLHLTFDSGQAVDATGNQTGIVTSGAKAGQGEFAGAFNFNGTSDYVSIPDFDYGPFFTVSFWFNSSSNAGTLYRYMFSHNQVHATHSVNVYFVEDSNTEGNGRIKTTIVDENDPGSPLYFTQTGLSDNQWHLYTVSVGSDGMSVFVDGELINTWEQGGDTIQPQGPIILGRRSDMDLDRSYNGYLDEVRVYDRALSAAEIVILYQQGR